MGQDEFELASRSGSSGLAGELDGGIGDDRDENGVVEESARAAAGERRRSTVYERWIVNPTPREARILSWFSIAFTGLCAIFGFVLAVVGNSASTLGFSVESFVDMLSSVLVLWRFWGPSERDDAVMRGREKRASTLISMVFVLMALVVGITAIANLAVEQPPTDKDSIMALSVVSLIVLTVETSLKMRMARQLGSISMKKDGICSIASGGLTLAIIVSLAIYEDDKDAWWLDSVCALCIAAAIGTYGALTLRAGGKWYNRRFWTADGVHEDDGGVVAVEIGPTDDLRHV